MQAFKNFLNPPNQETLYRRVAGILMACISIIFVILLVSRLYDSGGANYFSDGKTVLKLAADNSVTVYRER